VGVAALVLGIVSVVFSLILGGAGWVGPIIGIVGIVLGAVAKKKGQGGIATAGLVLSIIGTAISLIITIACIACVNAAESAVENAAIDLANDLANYQ